MTAPSPLASPSISQSPLHLTIRFSASLPDLELDITHPGSTTVASLKHLIRSRLEEPNSQRRLRFIQGGRILPDAAVLSAVLRVPPAPPPPSSSSAFPFGGGDADNAAKSGASLNNAGKGKSVAGRLPAAPRIYVNCSIGDSLTDAELAAEASAATAPPAPVPSSHGAGTPLRAGAGGGPGPGQGHRPSPLNTTGAATNTTTTPTPRGFDRLLTAGFTAAEVNQLRLQFRSIHSSRYTPDSLPSPDSFRRMEDAWIDDNGAAMPAMGSGAGAGADGGGGGGAVDADVGIVAMIDVMMRGVVTGFFWPLGSMGWLMREEGMSSGQWRWMVGFGVFFSLLLGIIRQVTGDR